MNVVECPISDADISNSFTGLDLKEALKVTKNEIKHLHKMRHENIITMLGIYYEGDTLPMLIVESVQFSLYEYLRSNTSFMWNDLCGFLEGASSGLLYLHEVKEVCHNNISVRTILLTKHLTVKLSSFEYARPITYNCRKLNYRKPNNDNFNSCDTHADVNAFGVVMDFTLSCKPTDEDAIKKCCELLQSYAIRCTNKCIKNPHPTSSEILDAIKQYR